MKTPTGLVALVFLLAGIVGIQHWMNVARQIPAHPAIAYDPPVPAPTNVWVDLFEPSEFIIAIGNNTQVSGAYNVAIGDNLVIAGGNCHLAVGPISENVKRLAQDLKRHPADHLLFGTASVIEQHCSYKSGSISALINEAIDLPIKAGRINDVIVLGDAADNIKAEDKICVGGSVCSVNRPLEGFK